ncbi:MAG: hisH2 [Bacteroidetes bacterium]|jgi:glutamine amidotransferase|nr:hisH2 [Bacteroidota bacterium]MDF2452271.1 hisH2 [Bacteroidota bacterium]
MSDQIVIIDYGVGNINSIKKKLNLFNKKIIVSKNPIEINDSSKIILPGVGHFSKAMESLRELNLIECLNKAVLIDKKPVLGICLGMQLMALKSEEGDVNGLGWINAEVVKFKMADKLRYKVPHLGWNTIQFSKKSKLIEGVPDSSEFYFSHSYHLINSDKSIVLNETEYEYKFISAIESENIYGVQYHPEKSYKAGEMILKNFINL